MMNFGWWTTGRDKAAVDLLKTAIKAIEEGRIRGKIAYIFLSRDKGESIYSDDIIGIATNHHIEIITKSAKGFEPELRERDRERWRSLYHQDILKFVRKIDSSFNITVVLAGYMWVVSKEACEKVKMINLHPALPGGPEGTWQEVIWKLIEARANETGAMMHLVTPELDKGPPIAYFSFKIHGGMPWDSLWNDLEIRLKEAGSLDKLRHDIGEGLPLFKKIREEGVRREFSLIVETMKAISEGKIDISSIDIDSIAPPLRVTLE